MRGKLWAAAAGLFAALLVAGPVSAQETYELKMAHYVPPGHFFSKYLADWAKDLEEQSDGRLQIEIFDSAQMGPTPRYFDFARTGVADITWWLHGATPGRFPLTELINTPFLVGSAEIGTKVLNDPEVREYLDKEHEGVKVFYLLTHQPGNLHTAGKPVREPSDLQGMRIRFAAATIRDYIDAIGGTPVGVPPPEMAEALQKKTIDGVFIDYGGAHTAFKLGGLVDYTTELYAYVTSFGVGMNQEKFDSLPPDLQQLMEETTTGVSEEIGKMWDAADAPGKEYLMEEGMEPIVPSEEAMAEFREAGREVTERVLANMEEEGLPAREVHELMRNLAAEHAKDSFSFHD